MSYTKINFINSLLKPEAYDFNPKKISLIETSSSYLFKADKYIYKIKKISNEYSTIAVKEAFCHEECKLNKHFNPDWNLVEVLPVIENNGVIKIGGKKGIPIDYTLKMEALPQQNSLSHLLAKNMTSEDSIFEIAKRIAKIHAESITKDKNTESWKPEVIRALCDDMLFQMKRYFDSSKTQPILDMIRHPLEKFIDENKKLFNRRQKKGRVVLGHGSFLPEHIFVNDNQVIFISPKEVRKNFATMDIANDVSSLSVELFRLKKYDLYKFFLERYYEISNDQDLFEILPLFQTYCALKQGVKTCELKVAQQDDNLGPLAMDYFHLAVNFSREIPRSKK